MNTSFEENDELRRLWQGLDRQKSGMEVHEIMQAVEIRATKFERMIFWRNVREYAAAVFVACIFAFFAAVVARTPMEKTGYALVSAGAIWILLFMWLMQRSKHVPRPESSAEDYRKALLASYDRQILLNRTAWAWYVLPLMIGLVIVRVGDGHSPVFGFVWAGLIIAFGIAVAVLNWKAASGLAAEKQDLERLFSGTREQAF